MRRFKIVRSVKNGLRTFKIKKRFLFFFYIDAKIPTASYTSFLKNSLTVKKQKWQFHNYYSALISLEMFLLENKEERAGTIYKKVACHSKITNRFKYFLIDESSETSNNVYSKFIGIW